MKECGEDGCKEWHHHRHHQAGKEKRRIPQELRGAEHHLFKHTVLTLPPAQRPGPGGL